MNENIASLWTFAYSPLGSFKSPWGKQPVRLFATPTGQAYSFQYHVTDKPQALGHYLVFAPSGSGKSTLMMHLLGGMARSKQREGKELGVKWDKDKKQWYVTSKDAVLRANLLTSNFVNEKEKEKEKEISKLSLKKREFILMLPSMTERKQKMLALGGIIIRSLGMLQRETRQKR